MGEISRNDYLKMVFENRKNSKMAEAITIALEAKIDYPQENVFEKLLGDLYFQQKQYEEAGKSYIQFLGKLGKETQYIKHFANFLQKYLQVVDENDFQKYIQIVAESIDTSDYTEEVKKQLCRILAPHINIAEIKMFEDDHNFKRVTSYIRKIEKTYQVYMVYLKVLYLEHTVKNKNIDKYIVSSMEKKGEYQDALQLIEKVVHYDTDQVAVRTLFRICRKLDDYTVAENYIQKHPEVKKNESFNVLYELVFYFSKTSNIEERNLALKKIEKCGSNSIPILRTLYNFYLQFGMIDKAAEITTKLSALEKSGTKKTGNSDREIQEEEAAKALLDVFRELFEELEHSRKLISMSELLKGFSHELGQPITNIRYSIQLYQMKMDMGLNTEDELKDMLEDVLSQTLRVKKLLSRFSPIVSEKDNTTEFDVVQEINNIFDEFNSRLVKENISWHIDADTSFMMNGDKVRFDQVFYNLIGNSIYAINQKGIEGEIFVRILEQSDHYIILFEDNGIGIEEKYLNKIFEPFFTTKEHISNDSGGGEGLGLYIIWNIVRMFGGNIKVDKHFKTGARFIIEILKRKEQSK